MLRLARGIPQDDPRHPKAKVAEGVVELKKIGAYLLMGTAFVSCPCHLVFSLPLALSILGGTALGTALAAHTGLIVAAMTAYFFIALIGGSYLLSQLLKDTGKDRCSAPSSGRRKKKRTSKNRAAFGPRRPKARKSWGSRS